MSMASGTTRTPADILADLAELEADYEAAKTALKLTAHYDWQRDEWRHTVATYNGKKANLVAELRRAGGRVER